MERLTEWYDDGEHKGVMVKVARGEHVLKTLFDELDEGYLGMCELKAYEDIGLTPPEIMELSERDTAKAPEEIQDAYGDTRLICPNCRNSVINYFNRSRPPQFCMICGQRLRWED